MHTILLSFFERKEWRSTLSGSLFIDASNRVKLELLTCPTVFVGKLSK